MRKGLGEDVAEAHLVARFFVGVFHRLEQEPQFQKRQAQRHKAQYDDDRVGVGRGGKRVGHKARYERRAQRDEIGDHRAGGEILGAHVVGNEVDMPRRIAARKERVGDVGGEDQYGKAERAQIGIGNEKRHDRRAEDRQQIVGQPAAEEHPAPFRKALEDAGRKHGEAVGDIGHKGNDADFDQIDAVVHQKAGVEQAAGQPADDAGQDRRGQHDAAPLGLFVMEIKKTIETGILVMKMLHGSHPPAALVFTVL